MFIYYIVIVLSISSASILVLLSKAPGSVCAFWRLMFSTIFILPVWFSKGGRRLHVLNILAGASLALHFIFWMESLYLIPVVISTVLVVSYPFYSLVVDYFLFRETISLRQLIGLVLGFTSIILYYNPVLSSELNIIGLTYAVIGGVFAAIYFICGRYLRSVAKQSLVEYVFPTYLTGAFITLVYNTINDVEILRYSVETYLYFILLAMIPMFGGHTLMNYLLKHIKTSTVTALALAEPVGAGLLAYILLNQVLDTPKIILIALTLSSIFLTVYGETGEY